MGAKAAGAEAAMEMVPIYSSEASTISIRQNKIPSTTRRLKVSVSIFKRLRKKPDKTTPMRSSKHIVTPQQLPTAYLQEYMAARQLTNDNLDLVGPSSIPDLAENVLINTCIWVVVCSCGVGRRGDQWRNCQCR